MKTEASIIMSAPANKTAWRVSRSLENSVMSRRARNALIARVKRLSPPMKMSDVVVFINRVTSITKSMTFQIDRRYAFGAKMNPSAIIFMTASTKIDMSEIVLTLVLMMTTKDAIDLRGQTSTASLHSTPTDQYAHKQ